MCCCCSYLLAFLPEGSGVAEVEQLLARLDPDVLTNIQRCECVCVCVCGVHLWR